MRKKRFIITTTIPLTFIFFGGQGKALSSIYDVCAVSSPGEHLNRFAEQEGVRSRILKMEREISLGRDIVAFVKWIWLLICERPYVVHANTPKASLLATVAAWITFRPHRIYMCHGLRYQGCTGAKRRLLIMMERLTCFCATKVICVSNGVREQFAKDGICSLEKSMVVLNGSANGVDTDYFNPEIVDDSSVRQQYGLNENDIVCVFIGRMVRDKGCELLFKAIETLHKKDERVKLLLVGGRIDDTDAISAEAEKTLANSEFIIECGAQKDVRPFLKAASFLVLPSYREGFGQVLIEANSMGIPVIASDIIGCNNVVKEGVNGYLCEPRSLESLQEKLEQMVYDTEQYNRIKNGCRAYCIDNYDRKKVSKAYVEYYTSLIKE